MKHIIRFLIVAATALLMWMDFKISAVSRIDTLIDFSQSIRNFTSMPSYSSTTQFPFNVPSYVTVHMTKELNALSDMANYKEVSLNPTNRENLANERETSVLESDEISSAYRVYLENSNVYLTRYDPIVVEPSCVQCHGSVDTAMAEQIEMYGRDGGFNYKVGDIYGLKVASIDITWFLLRYVGLAVLFGVPVAILVSRYNRKLNAAMNIDALSGAFNKNYYLKTKHTFGSGYFLLFDIDDFKQINDTHGHQYGDMVISQVCQLLKSYCRDSDQLFRFGGEEFALFMQGDASKLRVEEFLKSTLNEIRQTSFGDEQVKLRVTVSIGVCHKVEEQHIDDVMSKSDKALYQVKCTGKDNFLFYEE
ncbi:diguanylate cyclase [Vibrio campbellii]|uniref:diguanylate cyclase n=1 Tax=Vibrio campbellii TaxID=680 RepID=UPI000CF42EBC|nr:diguanylate cyclase [Vibrio campbellii]PQJ43608.1 diguanylate cyclase [Vibrio campbellii]